MTERDEKGRFVEGNKASPGRPPRATERDYLDALIGEIPLDKWRKIVRKAVEQALEGGFDARRWLAEYIIGKPPAILELRASEAALLRDLLNAFEQRGMSASEVFHALLAQIAAESEVEDGR